MFDLNSSRCENVQSFLVARKFRVYKFKRMCENREKIIRIFLLFLKSLFLMKLFEHFHFFYPALCKDKKSEYQTTLHYFSLIYERERVILLLEPEKSVNWTRKINFSIKFCFWTNVFERWMTRVNHQMISISLFCNAFFFEW